MTSCSEKCNLQRRYAETKAMGEVAMREATCDDFMTVAVAPHQVYVLISLCQRAIAIATRHTSLMLHRYGPRDNLFLPNILEAGGTGRLRIFGDGTNRICFTHVDNYVHGLIIAERAL
jgi:hypothetical protein